MITGKKVLLTGGAGFIGTALARRLLADNDVVVYDIMARDSLSSSGLIGHPRLTVIRGDVLDPVATRQAMEGCTVVVHLAAIAGVDTVLKMPVRTMKVNLIGTYHVLEAAVDCGGVERLLDFSTSEVFGSFAYHVQEGDVTALGAVGEARWTYAVSKLATEHMAVAYYKEFGLPAVTIRPFNIYGPGQVGEGAIHHFVTRAIRGEDLEIHNDGNQIRAWCFVDDIVDGILLCLEKPEAVGEAFNIGNPRSVCTIWELGRLVCRLAGSGSKLIRVPKYHADVALRIPNIDKARKKLGFDPKVELDDGLERTIAWYRSRMAG